MHLSPRSGRSSPGTAEALGLAVDLDTEAGVEACLDELGRRADVAKFTVRASTTPTMLDAGYKVNVIPGVATAEVDVRCPPGFADQLEATLPGSSATTVEYEYTSHSLPISAPVDGPWFEAMQDAVCAADPGAVVFPYCMGGGTDAKAFAPLGIAGYGFAPLGEDPARTDPEGVHGVDERVPVASLLWGRAGPGRLPAPRLTSLAVAQPPTWSRMPGRSLRMSARTASRRSPSGDQFAMTA